MKVERFIIEYANYRIRELNRIRSMDIADGITAEELFEALYRRIDKIQEIVKARENGLVSVNEAMKRIAEA